MNKKEINGAILGETVPQEGDREDWREYLDSVVTYANYATLAPSIYKVTYDNGMTVEVHALDKFDAMYEADQNLISRGYDLDDLMFSPTVEVV